MTEQPAAPPALEAIGVSKHFVTAAGPVPVLHDVTLALAAGQSAAIMGPSGSGKSTLLHILGTLDTPTAGRVAIDGHDPTALSAAALALFRNRSLGFVFQDHCLLPHLSVLENVLVPTLVGEPRHDAVARATQLLDRVGLSHRLAHRPGELSGGEKQRVAIARALVNRPRVVLCDEPTGNLDRRSADEVAHLLAELTHDDVVLVVVTHSAELAGRLGARFELHEGTLRPHP